ncbi:hypothetical protein B0J14DRAFT_669904 [Halenospora varia]|nr:hypothetical protein B0J14DRAFT_669904 [Halenospora varia]
MASNAPTALQTPHGQAMASSSPPSSLSLATTQSAEQSIVSSTAKKTLALTPEILTGDVIKLYIGSKRKEFIAHKKLLCDRCEFFRKGFNGGFEEALTGEMYLPEDNEEAFAHLIDYLYRGSLPSLRQNQHNKRWSTSPLRILYCLAEKLVFPVLMDELMDFIMLYHIKNGVHLAPSSLEAIYTTTHQDSKLRLYCAAMIVCSTSFPAKQRDDWVDGMSQMFLETPEIFRDFFIFQAKYGSNINGGDFRECLRKLSSLGVCFFHSHTEKEVCYLKQKESQDN